MSNMARVKDIVHSTLNYCEQHNIQPTKQLAMSNVTQSITMPVERAAEYFSGIMYNDIRLSARWDSPVRYVLRTTINCLVEDQQLVIDDYRISLKLVWSKYWTRKQAEMEPGAFGKWALERVKREVEKDEGFAPDMYKIQ